MGGLLIRAKLYFFGFFGFLGIGIPGFIFPILFEFLLVNYFNFTSSFVNHLWSLIFMPSFIVMSEMFAGRE